MSCTVDDLYDMEMQIASMTPEEVKNIMLEVLKSPITNVFPDYQTQEKSTPVNKNQQRKYIENVPSEYLAQYHYTPDTEIAKKVNRRVGGSYRPPTYNTFLSNQQVQQLQPQNQIQRRNKVAQQQIPMHQQQTTMHQQQTTMHQQQTTMHQQQIPMHQQQIPMHQQQIPMHQQQTTMHQQQSPMVQQQVYQQIYYTQQGNQVVIQTNHYNPTSPYSQINSPPMMSPASPVSTGYSCDSSPPTYSVNKRKIEDTDFNQREDPNSSVNYESILASLLQCDKRNTSRNN